MSSFKVMSGLEPWLGTSVLISVIHSINHFPLILGILRGMVMFRGRDKVRANFSYRNVVYGFGKCRSRNMYVLAKSR